MYPRCSLAKLKKRPVVVEIYTPERKAELLLSNAVDPKDYQAAVEEVRKLGIDPGDIPRYKKFRKRR
jgi:hypothetical protein